MKKVRPWCGQPSDRGRLKNRNRNSSGSGSGDGGSGGSSSSDGGIASMSLSCGTDAGMGAVDVAILDAAGNKDTARPSLSQKADGVWVAEYAATAPGLHSVNVFFAGKAIPNSPFGVIVAPGLSVYGDAKWVVS